MKNLVFNYMKKYIAGLIIVANNFKVLRRRNTNVRVTKMLKPNNKKYSVNKFPLGKSNGNFFSKGNKPVFLKVGKKG